jgi:hypothetical protein
VGVSQKVRRKEGGCQISKEKRVLANNVKIHCVCAEKKLISYLATLQMGDEEPGVVTHECNPGFLGG